MERHTHFLTESTPQEQDTRKGGRRAKSLDFGPISFFFRRVTTTDGGMTIARIAMIAKIARITRERLVCGHLLLLTCWGVIVIKKGKSVS